MFKYILPCLLLFSVGTSCTRHLVTSVRVNPNDVVLKKQVKIALVGFLPFDSLETGSSTTKMQRVRHFQAKLAHGNPMKNWMQPGVDYHKIPPQGIDKKMSRQRISNFINLYLKHVKRSGKYEIKDLLEIKKDKQGNITSILWKKRDVDYYVMGIHLPAFETTTKNGSWLGLVTFFTCMLTWGITPAYSRYISESKFYVFDRDLNLLKSFKYEDDYSKITSFWVIPNGLGDDFISNPDGGYRSPHRRVFRPHINRLKKDLVKFLNSLP